MASLNELILRLRGLGDLTTEIAPEVAKELETELQAQISAGTAPDGTPWQPTKTGQKPLKNAFKAIEVKAVGSVVLARLKGPEVRHHLGTARGKIKRQILPSRKLPDRLVAAINTIIARRLKGE